MTWGELPGLFPGFDAPGRWLPLLQRHLKLVEAAAEHTRVTAVPAAEAVRRQYAESLELLRIGLGQGMPELITDVGSGGGYPGLVVAAVLPDTHVALVEPLQKRARLLRTMADELGLENVEVQALRAEEAGRGPLRDTAQLVTARALAPLAELLEYTAPLTATGGTIALPKGSGLDEEMDAAKTAMSELRCDVVGVEPMRPAISSTLRVVLVRKVAPTPERYPRRPGIPGKRPLK